MEPLDKLMFGKLDKKSPDVIVSSNKEYKSADKDKLMNSINLSNEQKKNLAPEELDVLVEDKYITKKDIEDFKNRNMTAEDLKQKQKFTCPHCHKPINNMVLLKE